MAFFRVKAGTLEGKVLFREMEADSGEELARRLESEGLYPIDIRAKGFTAGVSKLFKGGGGVKSGDLLVFNQGLYALLKAGLSLIDSLEALGSGGGRTPRLSEAVRDTVHGVRDGLSLSQAMAKRPEVFPPLYVSSISAGESTGDLLPAIKGYIEFQKRSEAIRKKVVSAVTYPLVMAIASVAVTFFLLAYVVPSFTRIYTDTGAPLPLPTEYLIRTTDFIRGHIVLLLVLAVVFAVGLGKYIRSERGAYMLDRLKLTLPTLGGIFMGYAIAKFARTLGMVLKSGVSLVNGLGMSKGVLNNRVLEEKMERIIKRTREGEPVSASMGDEGLMPDITLRMFSVGERSASLPEIMDDIADYHEQEVAHKVDVLTDLIEPALMIIMGFVIGTIVVLMYLPIFKLGERI